LGLGRERGKLKRNKGSLFFGPKKFEIMGRGRT
jgi:hypothetical protein